MEAPDRFTPRQWLILAALIGLPLLGVLAGAAADVPLLALPAMVVVAGLIGRHPGFRPPAPPTAGEEDDGGSDGGGGPRVPDAPSGPPLPSANPGPRARDHSGPGPSPPSQRRHRRGHERPRIPARG